MVFRYTVTSTLDEVCYDLEKESAGPSDSAISELTNRVCSLMGIDVSQMKVKTKEQKVVFCRWLIWFFAMKIGYSRVEAATFFPPLTFDRTTINHSILKLPVEIERTKTLSDVFHKLRKIYAPGEKFSKHEKNIT